MIAGILFGPHSDGLSNDTPGRRNTRCYRAAHPSADSIWALAGQESWSGLADCQKRSGPIRKTPSGEFYLDSKASWSDQNHVQGWHHPIGTGSQVPGIRPHDLPLSEKVIRHKICVTCGVFLRAFCDNIIFFIL